MKIARFQFLWPLIRDKNNDDADRDGQKVASRSAA